MAKQILTNSSLSTLRACPRKYEIRYEMGYVPVQESEFLTFGKLMHKGIEAWSEAHDMEASVTAIYALANETKNLNEFLVARAHALMEGYHNKYKDEPYKPLMVEEEFRAPLLNPETTRESQNFILGGVMDKLIREDVTARVMVRESKTTSESIEDPTSDYWFNLMIDSQISTYYLGAEVLGHTVAACQYDVMRRPTLQPYKATPEDKRKYKKDGTLYESQREKDETVEEFFERVRADIAERPNYYFARREVPRLAKDLEDFMFDTWGMAQTLRAYQIKNKFPRFTRSCISLHGTCPYFAHCTGRASLEDKSLFKKVENKHQELKKAA